MLHCIARFTIWASIAVPVLGYSFSHSESRSDLSKPNQEYIPCRDGPIRLNQIDSFERDYGGVTLNYEGKPITAEGFAEVFIRDCSDRLTTLSMAMALSKMENEPTTRALIITWQRNLDYMKWWLTNRRQKQR
jgi:hypothetical protein